MKHIEKKIQITILKHREEEIDEIFQELSRGNSVYFMMTMDINEIDKVFFSYGLHLKHSINDADFYKNYILHYSSQRAKGIDFLETAKVIDAKRKDRVAIFTLSMPIPWEEETIIEDVEKAETEAMRIIRSAKGKAYAERTKILKQTEQDCFEMREKAMKEIKEERAKLNRLSNRLDMYLSTISKRDCLTKEEELHSMLRFLTLYQDEDDLILYKDEESFRKKIQDLKWSIRWRQREHGKNENSTEMRINWTDSSLRPEHMSYREWEQWGTRLADYFDDVAQLYAELRPKLGLKTSLTKVVDCYLGINELLEGYGLKLADDYVALWEELVRTCSSFDLYKRRKKEQEREEKEIERERIKAEKEYAKAIRQAEKDEVTARRKLKEAQQELEKQKVNEKKYNELKEQISKLERALQEAIERGERAISMAQQTKKGFVYIISNVDSFGENVFKIGLTRRLDPTERIDELSNASVPFPFQIHAIIESEDAPTLEAKLHRIFYEQKMNKNNWRKEFFKITTEDIRKVLKEEGIEASIVKDYSLFDYGIDF